MPINKMLENDIKRLCKSLDVNFQTEFVKAYEKIGDSAIYGGKHCGSDAEHEGSHFIAEKCKEIGLSNVELIPCETSRYQFNDATITIEGETDVIKPYGYVSPGTDADGITAEIINVNKSTEADYADININGKIALFAAMGTLEGGNLAGQMMEAIKNGAAAIVIYAIEDVLDDETIRVQPPNLISEIPIVGICKKDADRIIECIAKGPCTINLKSDAEYIPNGGTTYNVVAEIPGKYSNEKIIYTAHLDHYFRCLQDNISSCSTLLGIAKAIIDSGIKPNRTIVFAFHGSHETGCADSRYPYIYGSYKLACEQKTEWKDEAIADINFEYTALRQKKFQMLSFLGFNDQVTKYFDYSPEFVGGFQFKQKEADQNEYYMFSWADCISYINAGIPAYLNDSITEQLYEGTGDYVGRDHSNKDNWDAFDERALEDIGRQFGGLGLYLDSLPYMHINMTETVDRIRNEIDREALDAIGIDADSYFTAVDELETAGKAAQEYLDNKNDEFIEAVNNGMTDEEIAKAFAKAAPVNKIVKKTFAVQATELDKINAYDFLQLATAKYLGNVAAIQGAIDAIKADDIEKAFGECVMAIDLAPASYFFSEGIAEHMRKQICDPEYHDMRTWANGREMHIYTHFNLVRDMMAEMEASAGFDKTLANLKNALKQEISHVQPAMDNEKAVITKMTEIIGGIYNA